mmetsp:Transcript_18071/g.27079  ORF Transcript_18071/g.27079 Transcript_18071/m.27079 type:complete len:740 (+) Transcript_18071:61-2280(+)
MAAPPPPVPINHLASGLPPPVQVQLQQQQHHQQQQQLLPPPPPVPLSTIPPPPPSSSSTPQQSLSLSSTLSKLNPTTIILTHIPPFLRHPRNLRDLLYSTTTIKHLFYSCPIKRFANDTSGSTSASTNATNATSTTSSNTEDGGDNTDGDANDNDNDNDTRTIKENENVIAVVKFSHAGDALSLIRNWKYVQLKLNEQYEEYLKASNSNSNNTSNNNNNKPKTESQSESKPHFKKCAMNAFLLYTDGPNAISLHPEKSKVDANMIESIWELTNTQRDVQTDAGKVAQQADDNMISSLVDAYRVIEQRQYDLDRSAAQAAAGGNIGASVGANASASSSSLGVTNVTSNTNTNDASSPSKNAIGNGNANDSNNDTIEETKLKLDTAKVRAAAGGGNYDEETDPLNAPEVLEAVAQFKKRLEVTQGGHRKKRKEYLEKRLSSMIKEAKERLVVQRKEAEEEEKRRRKMQEEQIMMGHAHGHAHGHGHGLGQGPGQGLGPPPPLPPPMNLPPPPLPPGVAPPQPSGPGSNADAGTARSRDTGRRGVSNLPAWMTAGNDDNSKSKKRSADDMASGSTAAVATAGDDNANEPQTKRKFVPSEANRDINARKERLVVDGSLAAIRAANEAADKKKKVLEYLDSASTFTKDQILSGSFPKLHLPELIPLVRKFVKEQMVEYLGEEEATLIDFVMNYLVKGDASSTNENSIMGKKVDGLLEEMKMVLEEDAESFVLDLFKKIVEVSKS